MNFDKFEFLTEKDHFKNMREHNDSWQLSYVFKDTEISITAELFIPKNEKGKVEFLYRELNEVLHEVLHFVDSTRKNIYELPNGWFFEIVKEAGEIVYKRDRIRHMLFPRE